MTSQPTATEVARSDFITDFGATTRTLELVRAGFTTAHAAPQPLPPELEPVEPLPIDALPETFRPWVADVAERMNCPADFVAVPLLVAASSLVARHVGIRPEARTEWTERGNLWSLIVGRAAMMKSPALSQALAPIHRLEARAADDHNKAHDAFTKDAPVRKLRAEARQGKARKALKQDAGADVRVLLEGDDDCDDAPIRCRYVVNDATYEKLGEILEANPQGVLSVRDEMRGLFMHLAKEDNATARAFFLQSWSGGSYTFDRIGRGTLTVPDLRLSMIGGIQPGPLSDLMRRARAGAADDGMIERFLIAWPDMTGEWRNVDRWPDSGANRAVWESFDRLDGITAVALGAQVETGFDGEPRGLPFLRFADDAREAFVEWRHDLERTLRTPEAERIGPALAKFRHHVPALALLLHVVDGGTGPVALAPTLRALMLAGYFESHTRRLHASGRRNAVHAARALLVRVQGGSFPDPFRARDVYRNQWAELSDRETVGEALELLAARGWLMENEVQTGGRPTTVYTLVEGACRG
jgi:Protein of unknown function (DUF3987)